MVKTRVFNGLLYINELRMKQNSKHGEARYGLEMHRLRSRKLAGTPFVVEQPK